jgi:GTPase SAR1 family protein
MTIEFSIAEQVFHDLVDEFSATTLDANEAQTRFSFIDRLLIESLGWQRENIKVEVYENGDRTDYECGSPRQLIVEAKKASSSFSFPPRSSNSAHKLKLLSLMAFNDSTKSAIEQVYKYCQDRGVPVAAICNGPQIIFFLASRLDGTAPLEGHAFVYDSFEAMKKGFNTIYEALSPEGIREKRLSMMLGATNGGALPPKLSASCVNYFEFKYSSGFQENLRNASSLVIEDIGRTAEVEKDFLSECYCESGPLSQYSLVGKNILTTRYSSLFSSKDVSSRIEDINPRGSSKKLSEKVVAEAIGRRPIVLLGDVGVGKTSFIKNLIQITAKQEFGRAIFVYFDLGSRGALAASTRSALLKQIEITLKNDYGINIFERELLEGIYKEELSDFDNGFVGQLKESQPEVFAQKRIAYLETLVADRENHLKQCLEVSAKTRHAQIIFVIDNADQRKLSVQQDAFLIANELASTWNSLVFLSLRPQTFHASKRSGAISAYPPKVFVIPPPKLEDAIERRLIFAAKIAEGRLPIAKIKDLSMHIESLAILIRALQNSLRNNAELYEFIVNVSGGNVRVAIELISKFLGNPNVESEKIIKTINEGGKYIIPLHEFAKGGLLGDYAYYQEDSSYAYNVFNVVFADKREHFLSLLLLGYMNWDGAAGRQTDGFIGLNSIFDEAQTHGFTVEQSTAHLRKLTRKKLIEATERRLLDDEEGAGDAELPESFRITSLGAYHLKRWAYEFSYLEAMSFDTPIFSNQVYATLAQHVNSQTLSARYIRAITLRNYLNEIWDTFTIRPYFDWKQFQAYGEKSFERVVRRLIDLGFPIPS